jgi:hypothetical protein
MRSRSHGCKWCVPHHRVLSKESAAQLDRHYERHFRRQVRQEVEAQLEEVGLVPRVR